MRIAKVVVAAHLAVAAFAAVPAAAQEVTNGLIGHWPLDEEYGTFVADTAGAAAGSIGGNPVGWSHGYNRGGATVFQTGIRGKCYSFSGAGNALTLHERSGDFGSPNYGAGSGDFTISCWVNITQPGTAAYPAAGSYALLYSRYATYSGRVAAVALGTAWIAGKWVPTFQVRDAVGHDVQFIDATPGYDLRDVVADAANPVWHLITMVRSGTTVSMYVDGALHGSGANALLGDVTDAVARPISFTRVAGARSDGSHLTAVDSNEGFFKGKLDDVKIWKRALSAAEIAQEDAWVRGNANDRSDLLLAHWGLNDSVTATPSGATVADLAGQSAGTVVAGTPGQPGVHGTTSYAFNGADDGVNAVNRMLNVGAGNVTVSGWVNMDSTTFNDTFGMIFEYYSTYSGGLGDIGLELERDSAGRHIALAQFRDVSGHNAIVRDVGHDLRDGAWHQVVATRDQQTVRLYVDGAERASQTVANLGDCTDQLSRPATYVRIGADNSGPNHWIPSATGFSNGWFRGKLDEVKVYARALSATDVTQRYSQELSDPSSTVTVRLSEGSTNPLTGTTYAGMQDTTVLQNNSIGQTNTNRGGVNYFDIGTAPNPPATSRRHALLRFDLTSLAGKFSSIQSVTLRLHRNLTDFSGNEGSGVVQLYQLADANVGWVEGVDQGGVPSAAAPGATWDQRVSGSPGQSWAGSPGASTAGTDYVNSILASSAYSGSTTSIDLALANFNFLSTWIAGGTNAGFFLKVQNESIGSRYFAASSEHSIFSLRPELIVTYAPAQPVQPSATATLSEGSTNPFTATAYAGTEDTTIIVNNSTGERDTNRGGVVYFDVGTISAPNGPSSSPRHGLVRFDLTSLAGKLSSIQSVTLRLFTDFADFSGNDNSGVVQLYGLADANVGWIEGNDQGGPNYTGNGATWNQRVHGSPGQSWAGSVGASTAGTDYVDTLLANAVYSHATQSIDLRLTSFGFLNTWIAGGTNAGFFLRVQDQSVANRFYAVSSEGPDLSLRPRLIVTYRLPDVVSPVVTITSPANGSVWSTSSVVVTATVADVSPTTVTSTPAGVSGSTPPGTLTGNVSLVPGPNTVTVTATDSSGNVGTASVTVIYDAAAPIVTIDAPAAGQLLGVGGSPVAVMAHIDDLSATSTTSTPAGVSMPLGAGGGVVTGAIALVEGSNTITLTSTDAVSHVGSASVTVVLDTTAPVLTLPGSVTVEATGPAGATATFAAPTAGDAIDPSPAVIFSAVSGSTFPIGTTTVTCTATDAAHNTATGSFTVTVRDTTAPSVSAPSDLVVEATGPSGATATFAPTATDSVSSATVACSPASGSTFALGTTTVTCTATDAAGNVATGTFSVTVRDTTSPSLAAADVGPIEATGPAGAAAIYAPMASDAVSTPTIVCTPESGSTFALGQSTVTCTATDAAGNVASGMFHVTVLDTTPPSIAVPADIAAEASSAAGAAVGFVTSASDLVDGVVTTTCSPASGSDFALGTSTVTCTATDAHGNAASATFHVTVVDTTPPVIAVPSDTTAEATGPTGAAVTFAATAEDLVDGTVTATCDPASGSAFALGTTTVTCSASDAHGNTASATFHVTVVDTTPPSITIPADVTAEATSAAGAAVVFTTTAADLVDGAVTTSCSPASGSTFPLGPTTVACTAIDAAGNTATATFVVTVSDTTAPTVAVPSAISVEAASSAGIAVTFTATATDLVDGAVAVNCTPASGAAFPIGTTTVTCSATDAHGNAASATFDVTVGDVTPPTIGVPADIVAEATGPSGATVTFAPTSLDLVDGATAATCSPASGSTFAIGTTTVTCTATDSHGNTASGTFTVTVRDTMAPTLNVPADTTVEATGAAGSVVAFTATATDLVDGAVSVSCAPTSGSTFPLGATTVTCTATDAHGNPSSRSFVVTVADTAPPTISAPSNMTVNATGASGAVVAFSATATDLVDGAVAVTCSPASGSAFPVGTTTVTCAATDAHGNVASRSFTITVVNATNDPASQVDSTIASLVSLLPSGSSATDQRIQQALAKLQSSRSSGRWIDATHLTSSGEQAFNDMTEAVRQLMLISSPSATVAAAIANVVESARVLAQTAVDQATGVSASELSKARADIADAAGERAAGRYDKAIDDYRKAWHRVS